MGLVGQCVYLGCWWLIVNDHLSMEFQCVLGAGQLSPIGVLLGFLTV
jgi:hypothetical protein